jgi:5-formyltetrahydrofolate cyclo-ligase
VLLPVVPDEPGPLDWARYTGRDGLAAGPLGLREPTGERLGVDAVTKARLVLVPALAADRAGRRLGRGGGYYDRTLPLTAADVPLVVVLNDEELVDALPVEPHDRRVTAALLADAGHIALGNNG